MNTRGLLLCDDTATCWWLQSHYMQAKHGTVKSSPRRGDCNGHTVNTWLTTSLLGLQYQSIVDLRSYLQVQLNQLRINHQCHIDAPVWTYALYKLSACYKMTRCYAETCLQNFFSNNLLRLTELPEADLIKELTQQKLNLRQGFVTTGMGDLQSKLLTVAEAKKRKADADVQKRKQRRLLEAEHPLAIEFAAA